MEGATHKVVGALTGAAYATAAGLPWPAVLVSAAIAEQSAHSQETSPDLDQSGPWMWARRVVRWVPVVGPVAARAMGHRVFTHWFGWPMLAWWWSLSQPDTYQWAYQMLIVGWASHLVGDAVFGYLPVLPFTGRWRFGLGLDTGGLLETGEIPEAWWLWRWLRLPGSLPFAPVRDAAAVALVVVLLVWPAYSVAIEWPDTRGILAGFGL